MRGGFNSQPLEGGCEIPYWMPSAPCGFNSQPLEGGCDSVGGAAGCSSVSTHSRSKAAALWPCRYLVGLPFQLTAARRRLRALLWNFRHDVESFNSQPLEGGCTRSRELSGRRHRFNSQPLEGGCPPLDRYNVRFSVFQLTAARRRLHKLCVPFVPFPGFNSQPLEGGCFSTPFEEAI